MEAQNNIWEGIAYSISLNQNADGLSSEDAVWIDSCFVEDPRLSEINLDVVRDALLDILIAQPSLPSESVLDHSNVDFNLASMSEETGPFQISKETTENQIPFVNSFASLFGDQFHEGPVSKFPGHKEKEGAGFSLNLMDMPEASVYDCMNDDSEAVQIPFKYDENIVIITDKMKSPESQLESLIPKGFLSELCINERDEESNISSYVGAVADSDLLPENIFMIWDLETTVLGKDETLSPFEEELARLEVDSFDSLISGMGDLSLRPS